MLPIDRDVLCAVREAQREKSLLGDPDKVEVYADEVDRHIHHNAIEAALIDLMERGYLDCVKEPVPGGGMEYRYWLSIMGQIALGAEHE